VNITISGFIGVFVCGMLLCMISTGRVDYDIDEEGKPKVEVLD
jgi:hypothetical protein